MEDTQYLLSVDFVQSSLIACALLGILSGVMTSLIVLRHMSFSVHATSELALMGAAVALVTGLNLSLGAVTSATAAPINANSEVACTANVIFRITISGAITPESTPSIAQAISAVITKSNPSRYCVCSSIYRITVFPPTRTTSTGAPYSSLRTSERSTSSALPTTCPFGPR